jgi:hypothetical protein
MLPCDAPTTLIDLASFWKLLRRTPGLPFGETQFFLGSCELATPLTAASAPGAGGPRQESCGRSKRSLQYRRSLCFDNAGSLL